ncbi:MAG TPA: SRPBCC family protein [Streptosporangiaceae bacterium]|nr:SRPBCC family protein [Streptosporangiaceae bacterium]
MAPTTTNGTAVVTMPSDTTIQITREFNAPRHLVFRAWTTPELITRWWAGDRGEVTAVEVDLRPGGTWRYVMRANGGFEVAFRGEYSEVVPGERIVSTEIFEAMPDKVAESTVTFTEENGRTTVTILVRHESQEDRDMHINSGMEQGMQSSLDHLEQVAVSLR